MGLPYDDTARELASLRGRVRKIERQHRELLKLATEVIEKLDDLRDGPWEPVEYELSAERRQHGG